MDRVKTLDNEEPYENNNYRFLPTEVQEELDKWRVKKYCEMNDEFGEDLEFIRWCVLVEEFCKKMRDDADSTDKRIHKIAAEVRAIEERLSSVSKRVWRLEQPNESLLKRIKDKLSPNS